MHLFNYRSFIVASPVGAHVIKDSTLLFFKSHMAFKIKSNKYKTKSYLPLCIFARSGFENRI